MFFLAIWVVLVLLVLVMSFDLSSWMGQELSRNLKRNMNLAKLVFGFAKLWGNPRFVQEADPRHLEISSATLASLRENELERERQYFSSSSKDKPILSCLVHVAVPESDIEYAEWSRCVTTLTR